MVKATGDIITVAGNGTAGYSGDNGPATAAELDGPARVAVDSAGDLFIADTGNNVVREITPAVTVTITPSGGGGGGGGGGGDGGGAGGGGGAEAEVKQEAEVEHMAQDSLLPRLHRLHGRCRSDSCVLRPRSYESPPR